MLQVVKKLKLLKKTLKKLNQQNFRNILKEVEDDRAALQLAQTKLHEKPSDVELQEQEKKIHQQFRKSSYLAEIFL